MSMSGPKFENDLLRTAFRDYWKGYREHTNNPNWPRNGQYRSVPEAIRGLTCGAKTRAGTPCKRIDLYWGGRCKLHGGLSTGPKTEAGKARARENGKLGGRGRVRKANPMEAASLQRVAPDEQDVRQLCDFGEGHKPNPVRTARFSQGYATEQCGIKRDGDLEISKANPMHCSEKLILQTNQPSIENCKGNPHKRDCSNTFDGDVLANVQCRDCANISAGFKCLAPLSGLTYPALSEWRQCAFFMQN